MKKIFVLSATFMLLALSVLAQGPASRKEKIEALKVAYITKKLNLTPEEAQKFWPVYNKYQAEMDKLRKDFRGEMSEELLHLEQLSTADAEKALNDMLTFKSSELELTKKYTAEFKKVLSAQKVVKLFVAEQEFKKELLRMLKERQKEKN
jgi:Spy/CpxP family protein refolding chaperone